MSAKLAKYMPQNNRIYTLKSVMQKLDLKRTKQDLRNKKETHSRTPLHDIYFLKSSNDGFRNLLLIKTFALAKVSLSKSVYSKVFYILNGEVAELVEAPDVVPSTISGTATKSVVR